MSNTNKSPAQKDGFQTLKNAFNEVDASFSNSGFLTAKVGRKITISAADVVETYNFYEDGILLYTLTLTYTDINRETLLSAERTA